MSRWEQIYRQYPPHAWLIGWLYVCWLRLYRWVRYLCGSSRRQWCEGSPVAVQARVIG